MTFWSNHGHLEHQIGKVAMRHFLSDLEVLLCISIPIRIASSAPALPPKLEPASPAAAPWRRRTRTSPPAPPEARQRFFWVLAALKTDLYWKLRAGDLRRSSRAKYTWVFVLNISGGRTFFGFGDPKQRTCTRIFPPVFVFRGVA